MRTFNLPGVESFEEMVVEIDEAFWNACMAVVTAYVQDFSWDTDLRKAIGKLVDLTAEGDDVHAFSITRVRRTPEPTPESTPEPASEPPRTKRKIMALKPKPKAKR